jgi:hypothetical protein
MYTEMLINVKNLCDMFAAIVRENALDGAVANGAPAQRQGAI